MTESLHMEDDDARQRSEQPDNPQGADKRAPDSEQGESLPEESAGPGTDTGAGGDVPTDGGGASRGGGSQGSGGGASYGGGSGN